MARRGGSVLLFCALAACSDAQVQSGNRLPTVQLIEPSDGAALPWGTSVDLCVRVEDPDPAQGPETLSLLVTSSLQGVLVQSEAGGLGGSACADGAGNYTHSVPDLLEGQHVLTAFVWDPSGGAGEDAVTVMVERPADAVPSCAIVEPALGTTTFADQSLTVLATVGDGDDPLDSLLTSWSSSVDGPLGPGAADGLGVASLGPVTLSPGEHYLSLRVEDPRGEVGACGVAVSVLACADLDGDGVENCSGDCDDAEALAAPGLPELADGIDNDCNGEIDDGTALVDDDGDGFAEWQGDCDDADPARSPIEPELPDGVDQDCDLRVDEGTNLADDDGDGACEGPGPCSDGAAPGDCDDADPFRAPGATEVLCDGIDQGCSGFAADAPDADNDGWDICDLLDPGDLDGLVADCADFDATRSPGVAEVACDGIDQDCSAATLDAPDVDSDGFDLCAATAPGDSDGAPEDCADGDASIHPTAAEVPDGVDQDCDGIVDEGTTLYDDDFDGASEAAGDCDDSDPTLGPFAAEAPDNEDDDCDGTTDEGTVLYDDDGDGFSELTGDCDDADPTRHPGAPEDGGTGSGLGDGLDSDCDGFVDEDTLGSDDDGDGESELGGDCDDADDEVFSGAPELCGNSIDDDCEGTVDAPDEDEDAFVDALCGGLDCDDSDDTAFPGAVEAFDTADDDCDGAYDEGLVPIGMVIVAEIMKDPSAVSDAAGEWIEVLNIGALPVNLHAWEVADDGGNSFVIDEDLIVAPGARVVVGTSDLWSSNGGYTPDFVYAYSSIGGMQLGNGADEVVLWHGALEIDRVDYLVGSGWADPVGASLVLLDAASTAAANDVGGNWCVATVPLPAGDDGTPGVAGGC